jgi:hypothetical protein
VAPQNVTAALHWRPANVHQCSFAQDVGIALTGFCKVDELRGDGLFDAIVTVSNPQRDANDLERDTQQAPRLGVEPYAIEEWSDEHGRSPRA